MMGLAHIPEGLQPYCGVPPDPGGLWARWNLDPPLVLALLLIAAVYAVAVHGRRSATMSAWRWASFYGGWALGALALVSPLCALSVSLSAARVAQHMVLAAVVAPLVALGLPPRAGRGFGAPLAAATAFAVALWTWHAPGPYRATFEGPAIYWAMHLSAFAAALWLWSAVFAEGARRPGAALAAALLTSLQMGLLGAVLTFAGRPLYSPHLTTTAAWGLSPLADQQLAGVIMWVPAGLILTAAVVAGLAVTLRGAEARAARPAWSVR